MACSKGEAFHSAFPSRTRSAFGFDHGLLFIFCHHHARGENNSRHVLLVQYAALCPQKRRSLGKPRPKGNGYLPCTMVGEFFIHTQQDPELFYT